MTSCRLGIRVQFEHDLQILQRILLQDSAVDLFAVIRRKSRLYVNDH